MVVKCTIWASGLEKWDKYFFLLTEQYINNLWTITSNNPIRFMESGQWVWNIASEGTSMLFFYSNHVSDSVIAMERRGRVGKN